MTLSPARDGCKAECGNSINNNANIRWLSQDLRKKKEKDLFSSITYHYDSLCTWILQQYFIFLCVKSCVQNFYIVLRINITNISTSSLFTSAGCTWWSLTLSCHHSGTFTPPHSLFLFSVGILHLFQLPLLTIWPWNSPRSPITGPQGRGTSGTSASWTCPPLALAGTEAPGWTGNVWRGRWCFRVHLRRSCPPRWTPGARGGGPWLAARRTLGAPEYGGPERRRSPDRGSCRGRHWTWPLREEDRRREENKENVKFKFRVTVTSAKWL